MVDVSNHPIIKKMTAASPNPKFMNGSLRDWDFAKKQEICIHADSHMCETEMLHEAGPRQEPLDIVDSDNGTFSLWMQPERR